MIDFDKKIRNSNKFRQAALHMQRTGLYTTAPQGTTEYINFWEEEARRCLHGYTAADGDYITGYHYFYLNYCPIIRITNKEISDKLGNVKNIRITEREFPDFYDYDYYYFQAVDKAVEVGKHLVVGKSRRKGFSYKAASMLNRNFYLIPESKSYVCASDKKYLTGDGTLTKAWALMDHIDEHTAWGKKRQAINTMMHRRASFFTTDNFGNKIESGYRSEIMGITLKDNPDAARGIRGMLILFEESGTFSELGAAWQIIRPSVEQDGVAFGLMLAFGTGGSEGKDIAALRSAFYNPAAWNCLGFKNIWDTATDGQECGFFVPQWTNMDIRDEDGKRLYMDDDGNTLYGPSLQLIQEQRTAELAMSNSTRALDRYLAERAICPAEAFQSLTGNIFPKRELQEHLSRIRTNKKLTNHKQVGDLIWNEGKLAWKLKKTGDITKYPLDSNDDPTGAIVIWEHPVENPPYGLYLASADSYDHDTSGTNSLGSVFIYKRFQNFEEYYDLPVAEYTGRPASADEFYENTRKLVMYYNATLLYENQNKGLFTYFNHKHSDYLLMDQPDILNDIVGNSKVQRKKGVHITQGIRDARDGWLKDWLNEEYSPGHKNLEKILSEPLLEELIQYNKEGNFDRVDSFGLIMIAIQQFHKINVKKSEDNERKNRIFVAPLFGKDLWEKSNNETNMWDSLEKKGEASNNKTKISTLF